MSTCMLFCVLFAGLPSAFAGAGSPDGKQFLGGPSADHLARDEEFRSAMSVVMGCGQSMEATKLTNIESALRPVWKALPKNRYGRVEWRLMRYMMHRYFMQQSSLLIRGFEPQAAVNDSEWSSAAILQQHASSLMAAHEAKRSAMGFSLEDAVTMIAALEKLMRDQEVKILETVYKYQRKSTKDFLSHQEFINLMEAYMAHWLMNDDIKLVQELLKKPDELLDVFPKWVDVSMFARGVVKSLEFDRERAPQLGHAFTAMTHKYGFEDALEAAEHVTRNFASFWETECQNIKAALVQLDKRGTGRVMLGEFYGANVDGEWRFGESESYLHQLGAIDDSSSVFGKQVIIPNYMQGASNCIAASEHYLVCCVNECEAIMNDIEEEIGSPVAAPEQILPFVSNMTDYEDDAPEVGKALHNQLLHIAEIHGGKIPLHGRLFAQWLHYVFPRECPFPYKPGQSAAVIPSEFGEQYMATQEEVDFHATTAAKQRDAVLNASAMDADENETALRWMSQWTEEEELIADYSAHLGSPWYHVQERLALAGGLFVLLLAFAIATRGMGDEKAHTAAAMMNPAPRRVHHV